MSIYDRYLSQSAKVKICIGWKEKTDCTCKVTGKGDRCHDCKYEHEKLLQRDYASRRRQAKAATGDNPDREQADGGKTSGQDVLVRMRTGGLRDIKDQHPFRPSAATAAARR